MHAHDDDADLGTSKDTLEAHWTGDSRRGLRVALVVVGVAVAFIAGLSALTFLRP